MSVAPGVKTMLLAKDMLRNKNTNEKGFTIIEVVITIAIGAAVMALVLNAVAGARRSQRNNARTSDISQLAGAINQYIGSQNKLPTNISDFKAAADDFTKLGHYDEAQINSAASWITGFPSATGVTTWNTAYDTAPAAGVNMYPNDGQSDYVTIINQGGCNTAADPIKAGGIRQMAIVYSLEGQGNNFFCLEV